jgi:hypothetical protein
MTKRSKLEVYEWSAILFWQPSCFDHSKSGQKKPGFGMVKTTLDRFINKSHKKYCIHAKTV